MIRFDLSKYLTPDKYIIIQPIDKDFTHLWESIKGHPSGSQPEAKTHYELSLFAPKPIFYYKYFPNTTAPPLIEK